MNRKDALRRLNGLAPRVERHLAKLATDPDSRDAPHWATEVAGWLAQMERAVPGTGGRTAAEWQARIDGWKAQLGG